MHTVADTGPLGSAPAARASASDPGSANASADPIGAATARVAVAGATGYTGQELLRLLSRHPGVTITQATSSGTTAARRLPALAHLWNGTITPLDADALARDADVVFLALPDIAAAELAPRLVDAGVRTLVSGDAHAPVARGVRAHRASSAESPSRSPGGESGLLPNRIAVGALAA